MKTGENVAYKVIEFDENEDGEDISVKTLSEFVADADMIISNYGYAWRIDLESPPKVEDSYKGPILRFSDGEYVCGYNIHSKLTKQN